MAKRDRNLAALAALGALGYMATRPKEDADLARETARAGRGPVASLPGQDTSTMDEDADLARETARAGRGPVASLTRETVTRPSAPTAPVPGDRAYRKPVGDDTTSLARETARAGRGQIIEKDKPTASTLPGAMGAYASRAGTRAPTTLDQALAEAQPGSTFTFQGKTYEKEPAQQKMSPTDKTSTNASSGLTLGTPTRPAPKAPSIYAGPEAWAAYRKQQAAGMKKGGAVKKMASGGSTSSASSRGDGIAQRGKTKGRMY